jgi:cyanophycin synthetase
MKDRSMHALTSRRLDGLNRWSRRRTLESTLVDVPVGDVPSDLVVGLVASLERLVLPPSVRGPRDRIGPTSWPEFVAGLAVEWQFLVREFTGHPHASRVRPNGTATIAFECEDHSLAEACLRNALTVAQHLTNEGLDLAPDLKELEDLAYEACFGGMSTALVDAARARGIPVYRGVGNAYVQLGEGALQRRFQASITGRTASLGVDLSNDKATTKALWARVGLPTAGGRAVTDADDAVRVALALGWPVAVKPADSDYGLGVALDLRSAEAVRLAYEKALPRSPTGTVLVERFLAGLWHRLLVVDDRLVAALRREPACVVGDGRSTFAELVERMNQDPRRGPDSRWPIYQLDLGTEECEHLVRSGLGPESVPGAGERVVLRPIAHTETGATSRDVTELVHHETVEMALDAVRMIGLDVAGLDVIAADIARPLIEQGGGFLEVNAGPAIFLHIAPVTEPSRPVPEAIVDALVPPPETGRLPLAVIIGRDSAEMLALRIAEDLTRRGRVTAVSTPSRTSCGTRRLVPDDPTPPGRLHVMMTYPRTELAILAVPAHDSLEWGLGTDRADLAVLAAGAEAVDDDAWETWLERLRSVTPRVFTLEGRARDEARAMAERVVSALLSQ